MTVGAVVAAMLMTGTMTAAAEAAGSGAATGPYAPVTTPDGEREPRDPETTRPVPTDEPEEGSAAEEPEEQPAEEEPAAEEPAAEEPPPPPAAGSGDRPPGYETSAAHLLGWGQPNRIDEFDDELGPGWDVY